MCVRCVYALRFYCLYFTVNNSQQPRKIGSVADIDPINGVYGSMEYNSYAHQSHSQPQQPTHHHQLHYAQQQPQSAIQQKPIQKSISSQVVSSSRRRLHATILM